MIAAAGAGAPDQLVGDGGAGGVFQPGPVATNEVGAARADKVFAVVVVDEEISVLAIKHARKDLGDQKLGVFIIRRRAAIDVDERRARDGKVVLQLVPLGGDQFGLEVLDLALGQLARLQRHQHGNGDHSQDQRQGGRQKQFLTVVEPEALNARHHSESLK